MAICSIIFGSGFERAFRFVFGQASVGEARTRRVRPCNAAPGASSCNRPSRAGRRRRHRRHRRRRRHPTMTTTTTATRKSGSQHCSSVVLARSHFVQAPPAPCGDADTRSLGGLEERALPRRRSPPPRSSRGFACASSAARSYYKSSRTGHQVWPPRLGLLHVATTMMMPARVARMTFAASRQ